MLVFLKIGYFLSPYSNSSERIVYFKIIINQNTLGKPFLRKPLKKLENDVDIPA